MPVRYYIPGVGVGVFDDGTTLEQAYALAADRYGLPQDTEAPGQPSAAGALGRGFVRGAAPAAAGLAAAIPGAEVGFAAGAAIGGPFAPVTGVIGGLVGGAATGIPAALGTSYAQQKVFQAAPGVASALGQSPEQVEADTTAHPYASMIGEVAPNLLAFRPSLAALGRIGEDTAPEAAAAIRSARVNAGINAAVSGAQEAGFEYANDEPLDPTKIALQAGMGALGQKETFIGRRLGAGRGLLPDAILDYNKRVAQGGLPTVDEDIAAGRPADLLSRTHDDGDTLDLNDSDQLYHRQVPVTQDVLYGDSEGTISGPNLPPPNPELQPPAGARYADEQAQSALPIANRVDQLGAFGQEPTGTQGDLFDYHAPLTGDIAPQVGEAPAPETTPVPGSEAPPVPLPNGDQPSLLDTNPTSTVRTDFGPREILQRLQGLAGAGTESKKMGPATSMDTPRPRDPFVYKTFTAITKNLANDNLPALEGYILDQRQEMEHAAIKPATIELRSKVLDAAQQIADDYRSRSIDAAAQEGTARAQPGVEVGEPAPPPEASATALREAGALSTEDARASLLDETLSKQNLTNPGKYFIARLKRAGLEPVVTEAEMERLSAPTPAPQPTTKLEDVQKRIAAAKKPKKEIPAKPAAEKPKRAATTPPKPAERAQEAPEQVKEAEPAPKAEEVQSTAAEDANREPEGLDTAKRLGKLSKSIDSALKRKEITASDRLKLNQLVRNGAHPDIIERAIEDAKEVRASKTFEESGKPRKISRASTDDTRSSSLPRSTPSDVVAGVDRLVGARLRGGDMRGAIDAIAKHHPNPVYQEIAKVVLTGKGIDHPVTVHDADRIPSFLTADATTNFDNSGKTSFEFNRNPTSKTALHEAIHAWLIGRVGSFDFPLSDEAIRRIPDATKEAVQNFLQLHSDVRDLLKRVPEDIRDAPWVTESIRSPDEFLTYTLTDPAMQSYLLSVDKDGNPLGDEPEPTMWSRVVDAVRRFLGLKPTPQVDSALTEIIHTQFKMIESAKDIPADNRTVAEQVDSLPRLARAATAAAEADRTIERLPEGLRTPARAVADTFHGKGSKVAAVMSFGPKLAEMAARGGLKSAKTLQRLLNDRVGIQERIDHQYADLTERFDALSSKLRGRGGDTVNGIVKDMVMGGKWAFEPTWLRDQDGNPVKVEIDPASARRFNALPAQAKKVLEDAFRLPHETLHDMWESVRAFVSGEHTAMIQSAQDKLDAAVKAGEDPKVIDKLKDALQEAEHSRDSDMRRYHRLFDVNLSEPYAPIRRFGNYVVVARSPEYVRAEDEAFANGHMESLDDMKTDPDHYFVDFVESRAQAEAMRRELARQYGPDVEVFTRDRARQHLFGGRDMLGAFQRVRSMVDEQVPSAKERDALHKMISDLMLSTLASTSSRKAEMSRLKVAGGDFDMVRSVIQHGRGSARFIAAMHKNSEILDALRHLDQEAARPNGQRDPEGREMRENFKQEILARYVHSMAPTPQNAIADKMTAVTALYMLMTSPSFFVQQMTQPGVMSVPIAAAEHGYAKTWKQLIKGYTAVRNAWQGTGLTGQLKIDQLPRQWRPLAHYLAERGRLDIGISHDMGDWTSDGRGFVKDTVRKVFSRLGGLTRKTEAINRVATGIMMYELEMGRKGQVKNLHDPSAYAAYIADFREAHPDLAPMTERQFSAAGHALKIIDDTHGTYDIANAPRFMRSAPARVVLQFKKFQLMQLQLYAQNIYDGFMAKDMTPTERAVARRALGYMTGHAAVVAGMLGLPGAALVGGLYRVLASQLGDPDKRHDEERDLREHIGDPALANVLLHGLPSLAGLNLSGSLGQDNLLSLAPYADTPVDKASYDAYVTQLLGPLIGGIGRNMATGLDLMSKGQTWMGMEKMLPRGLSAASRSLREAQGGEMNSRGEVLARDIPAEETLAGILGLNTTSRSTRQFNRNEEFEDEDFYKGRTADIRRDYLAAVEAKDSAGRQAATEAWRKLQSARAAAGFKPQPLSDLIRAPREAAKREKQTAGGVQYSRTTQGSVRRLNMLTDGASPDASEDSEQ